MIRRHVTARLLAYTAVMLGSLVRCTAPYKHTIPLGVILGDSSKSADVKAAIELAINKTNGDVDMPFRLNAYIEDNVDVADSYSVIDAACSKMKTGIFSLMATTSLDTLNDITSYANALHVPTLIFNLPINDTGQAKGYTFSMQPLYAKALVQYMVMVDWMVVYYMYEDFEGLWRLQHLYDALYDEGVVIKIIIRHVTDAEDAHKMMTSLLVEDPSEEKKILLDLSTNTKNELFEADAMNNDQLIGKYHFLIVGLDIDALKLSNYENGGINITGFKMADFSSPYASRFLKDWNRRNAEKEMSPLKTVSLETSLAYDSVLIVTQALLKFYHRHKKVFDNTLRRGRFYNNRSVGIDCYSDDVTPWVHGKKFKRILGETTYEGLTGRIAFDQFGLRKEYALDLSEVTNKRGLSKIAYWNAIEGLKQHQPQKTRVIKGNNILDNKVRIITSILVEPYLMYNNVSADGRILEGNARYTGFCADLMKLVAESCNISYVIRPVKDGKYGGLVNGSWNGMVGEIVRREADLAVAPLTITSTRERVMDFSKPFMSLGISIMIKKPVKLPPAAFSFMHPLSYEIWMCVIFAYIGVSVVLFLVSRFSPCEWKVSDNGEGPTATNTFTIFNSLWFSLGAFMQQGCDFEPKSVAGRVVGCVWWFFTLILISSYTANLAAFLTMQRMQSPIESAEDLARQTVIKYGTLKSGSSEGFFKYSTFPLYQRMWAFMSTADPSVFVSTNDEGLERVRASDGKYAFLTESTNINYMNQRQPCDTMKVGSNLDSKGYGVGTPLGSDIRDKVTLAVLQLREGGKLHELEKRWWYEKGQCGEEFTLSKETTTALNLENVIGCFYILAGGFVGGILISLLELTYSSKVDSSRKKTPFITALKGKVHFVTKGEIEPETQTTSYDYAPAPQLISLDGFTANTTQTQV